jgi:hypothetical protein
MRSESRVSSKGLAPLKTCLSNLVARLPVPDEEEAGYVVSFILSLFL